MNKFLSTTSMRALSAVLVVFSSIFIARLLGAEAYGHYVTFVSSVTLTYALISGGLPTIVQRETALDVNAIKPQWQGIQVLQFAIKTIVVVTIIILAIGLTVGALLNIKYWAPWEYSVTVFLAASWSLATIFEYAMRGQGRIIFGQLSELLLRPICLLLIFGFVALFTVNSEKLRFGAEFAFGLAIVASLIFSMKLLGMLPIAAIQYQPSVVSDYARGTAAQTVVSVLIKVSFPLSFIAISHFFSEQELGIYRAAYQLSIAVGLGLLAVKASTAALFARHSIKHTVHYSNLNLRNAYLQATGGALLITVAAAVPLMLFPEYFLALTFGNEYKEGASILRFLTAGIIINCVMGPIDVLLEVEREDKVLLIAAAARAAWFLLSFLVLTKMYGLSGAAIANASATVLWAIGLVIFRLKRKPAVTLSS